MSPGTYWRSYAPPKQDIRGRGCLLKFPHVENTSFPGQVGRGKNSLRFGKQRSKLPVPGRKRSEEHTSELQSLMRISYAVFCLKKKNRQLSEQTISQQYTHYDH